MSSNTVFPEHDLFFQTRLKKICLSCVCVCVKSLSEAQGLWSSELSVVGVLVISGFTWGIK